MRNDVSSIVTILVASICLAACSSGKSSATDAAAESASQGSCQSIRICIAMCMDSDSACYQACVARGSAEAQTMFQALATCTAGFCAAGDFNCACQEQCFAEGRCTAEVDTCVAGAVDDLACAYCR